MANAAKLKLRTPVRAMVVGYPGSAKTGGLASLANAGYKIRMLDFDGNTEPLLLYVKPQFLANIDIVNLEDKVRNGQKFIEPSGIPTAFKRALDLMDRWKYTEEDGTVVDLGASKDWGCDTIVVLDSLTAMGEAAMDRVLSIMNKNRYGMTQQSWQFAMSEQEAFIKKLTSKENKFHVVVLSHLKMVGPQDIASSDDDLTKQLKEKAAEIIPTRLYPSALGRQLPQNIAQHFPTVVEAAKAYKGSSVSYQLMLAPRVDLDLKVPAPNLPGKLDIADGMLRIFEAIAPPLSECLVDDTKVSGTANTNEGEK